MKAKDMKATILALAAECREFVSEALAPLTKRIAAVEERPAGVTVEQAAEIFAKGIEDLRAQFDAAQREVATLKEAVAARLTAEAIADQVRATVAAAVAAIEIPPPVKGDKGDPGEAPNIEDIVQRTLAAVQPGVVDLLRRTVADEVAAALTPGRVAEILTPLIPAPIKGDPGAPAAEVDVEALSADIVGRVAPQVAELVRAAVPTPEALTEQIRELIPAPVKGDKGDPGEAPSIEAVVESALPQVAELVREATTEERIAAIVQPLIPAPVKGEAGPAPSDEAVDAAVLRYLELHPVEDGKNADPEQIAAAVAAYLEEHPIEDGADGKDASEEQIRSAVGAYLVKNPPAPGKDGTSIEIEEVREFLQPIAEQFLAQVAEDVRTQVNEIAKSIPTPKDGRDVTVEEVESLIGRHTAKWQLEFEREARGFLQTAVDKFPKPKDGRDAVPVDGFELSFEGRKMTLTLQPADPDLPQVKREVVVPFPMYCGIYEEGKAYDAHDVVTWAGGAFIATRDTTDKPETSDAWKLFVKRGRDGKDFRPSGGR